MKNLDFDWQTNEFMLYCRSIQLREKRCLSLRISARIVMILADLLSVARCFL